MKRILVSIIAVCAAVSGVNAQAVEGAKFTDNWSVGLNVGGTTPLTHSAFFKNMRPVFGLGLTKQVTPVLGIGLEGMASVNTTASRTAFDNTNISLLNTLNLNNLFGGYKGSPRLFEVETVTGIGWLHYYQNGDGDKNSMSTKLGLNFNFNLGNEKQWTLGIKPALVYDMSDDGNDNVCFNANRAAWEFTVGLKYHFMNSNGSHNFTIVKPYDQAEVDALNAQINSLRNEAANNAAALDNANRRAADLQRELDNCRNQGPRVVKEENGKKTLESTVTFKQGSSSIESSQMPNVERVATYMKNHKGTSVSIKGYASPEGNADVNAKLAQKRAEAVKTTLVNKYKIASSRIKAEGQGVGNMFEEPDWNRVSICTISE